MEVNNKFAAEIIFAAKCFVTANFRLVEIHFHFTSFYKVISCYKFIRQKGRIRLALAMALIVSVCLSQLG